MDGSAQPATVERPQVSHAAPSLAPPPAPPPRRTRRRLVILLIAALVLAGAATYAWRWWTDGRFLDGTDDAYIAADTVTVSSRIPGQVKDVLVLDNQLVRRGDPLLRLDDADYAAALAGARADVAAAQADINALGAQTRLQSTVVAAAEADLDSAAAAAAFARADSVRYADLLRTGNGSVQRAQQADAEIKGRDAAAARARAALEGARAQVAVLGAQLGRAQATLLRARAAESQAALNLSYTTLAAPADGAVGDRTVRPGQYVQPGAGLMAVVPMDAGLYVVANFKETQLGRMGAGEAVSVDVDMLGGEPLRGIVDSLAPGSGSTFALLPPENATGNFTKIVQRVPVRIRLLPDDRLSQLRPGLSVTVTVDSRTAPPGRLQTLARTPPAAK